MTHMLPFAVAPFTNHIKSLSPSILDMELRMLQIIDDDDEQEPEKRQELHFIELLLDYFIHEISCRSNFEYIQALIRLFLKVNFCIHKLSSIFSLFDIDERDNQV